MAIRPPGPVTARQTHDSARSPQTDSNDVVLISETLGRPPQSIVHTHPESPRIERKLSYERAGPPFPSVGGRVRTDQDRANSFTAFAEEFEPRLRRALVASLGVQAGCEAAADTLSFGWENWERVSAMANPAGYLYRVGVDRGRRHPPLTVDLPEIPVDHQPWIEPGLPAALASLSPTQRTCTMLVHTYGYSLSEVAALLDVSKGSVQRHLDRSMRRLRSKLGVRQ